MKGRTLFIGIGIFLVIFAIGLNYAINYAYYDEENFERHSIATDQGEIRLENVRILNSPNTPLKLRICADAVDMSDYQPTEDGHPLVAPKWFDCFNAKTLDDAAETGEITKYRIRSNMPWGFDEFLATGNGGTWVWREMNECGTKKFEGEPLPAGCPPYKE